MITIGSRIHPAPHESLSVASCASIPWIVPLEHVVPSWMYVDVSLIGTLCPVIQSRKERKLS